MTLGTMKKKVLAMIEELNPESEYLTDDVDIKAKINDVINQIMFEVARRKKIVEKVDVNVEKGQVLDLLTLERFYQLRLLRFTGQYEEVENMIIFDNFGIANVFYYKLPIEITNETTDDYEFELTQDALEIMPYGIAGDLLKSDVSAEYGAVYSNRYESMLQRLDSKYTAGGFSIEGGVVI